jgi:FkbM family methyltransferase
MRLRKRLRYWLYGHCPGLAGSFPYYGTRVHFPRGSMGFREACLQNVFEADNVRLLQHLVKPHTTYLDIGANIGLMAIPILNACPDCLVVSFDPSPNSLPYLRRTVSESRFADRWTIVPRALSDSRGQAEFCLASKELSMFDGLRDTHRVTVAQSVTVDVSTLDAEWERLGRPAVSAIKCDVEGNELAILNGAGALLDRDRPFVLVEWNEENLRAYGCHPAEILGFCGRSGYRLFALPNFIGVDSALELGLHMTEVESFLLAPAR